MLKKLASKILNKEFDKINQVLKTYSENEKRLNNLVNNLSKENAHLRTNRSIREYSCVPESLTSEEQGIIDDFKETPIIELISKWFKIKADQNCDLFLHSTQAKEEHKSIWRLAVLMYDDWRTFLDHCSKVKPTK